MKEAGQLSESVFKFLLTICFSSFVLIIHAQSLGGSSVFNFLKLPNTPQLTGLGGINISNQSNDIGLTFNNPALLRKEMHTQSNLVFNSFFAGVRNYHLLIGYTQQKIKTHFAFGINFFNYGTITETDPSGNIQGSLKPVDYVLQLSAARQYLQKWHYGGTLKFIHSDYGQYRSSGIALDVGITYTDSIHLMQAAILAKNMGVQIKPYEGTAADELPFDLQAGISFRLQKAPIGFSFTAHHLHAFDIRYNDTAFNNEFGSQENKRFTIDKIFRHFVIATQLYITDKLEISTGYNHLRRKELNIGNAGNGFNGFSIGVGVLFKKIQIRYARSYYQNHSAYNQFGLSLKLNEYFGLGKFGSRIGW